MQLTSIKMRRRAAAEEEGLHALWFLQCRQLNVQRFEIKIDEMILPCDDGEVAVAAVMRAERHVNVGGARPKPRRRRSVVEGCPASHRAGSTSASLGDEFLRPRRIV